MSKIILFFSLVISTCCFAAKPENIKQSKWKGFTKSTFTVSKKSCFLIEPKKSAPGNPWVWRARWPSYHTEVDLLLLADGYHIAYINTNGLLGAPSFLPFWEDFYKTMTQEYKLNKKAAHYTVSRGGLFTYRWARKFPETVACIYADTPVLDFKSWPGGKGKGVGAPGEWKKVMAHYKFASEEEAMNYNDNAIDNLQVIVNAKIPLLHIVSETDRVVPPTENTYILKQNLEKIGGHMEVISMTTGTEKSKGHHFPLTNPEQGANFIRKYTQK